MIKLTLLLLLAAGVEGLAVGGEMVKLGVQVPQGAAGQGQHARNVKGKSLLRELKRLDPV